MMSENAQKHFARYLENVALASDIDEFLPTTSGWSCVVRFYAALHLINAYLVDKRNVRFTPAATEHRERKGALAQCPELRDTPDKYRQLKDISEAVRYNADFEYNDTVGERTKVLLRRIVTIIEPKLKK